MVPIIDPEKEPTKEPENDPVATTVVVVLVPSNASIIFVICEASSVCPLVIPVLLIFAIRF